MTLVPVQPDQIQIGDTVLLGDSTYTVKAIETDYNRAYDLYAINDSGSRHEVITDSITLVR
jgi:hypothetical protein